MYYFTESKNKFMKPYINALELDLNLFKSGLIFVRWQVAISKVAGWW